MPADKSSSSTSKAASSNKGKGKSVPKAPGLKRAKTGCESCRQRRHKCTEERPQCSRCVRSSFECLYPVEIKKTVYKAYGEAAPPSSYNAAASSSRIPPSTTPPSTTPPFSPPPRTSTSLYKTPTSDLELSYPDPTERLLLHHALALIPSLTMASPVPLTHTPDSPFQDFLMPSLRGSSTAHEAFSLSLLSVGAVILSYFHHTASEEAFSSISLREEEKYRQLANAFVDGSLSLVKGSLVLAQVGQGLSEQNFQFLSLAAGMSLLNKCLSGGGDYSEALLLARRIVGARGGPRQMLEDASATGDPVHLRRVRTVLEKTVMWSIFSCLSTGLAPDLSFPNGIIGESIEPQHEPLSSYYFLQFPRPLDALELHDWDSVETMLGMSRGLVELLHRINSLYFVSRPSGVPGPGEPPLPVDPLWISQANVLLVEVATWRARVLQRTASLPDGIQISRVDMGNLIYTHMFEVILYIDLLAYSPSHPVVQHAALEILHLLELQTSRGLVLGLMWPWLIAGSMLSGASDRSRILLIAEDIKTVCCFDLHSARAVLHQVWLERDHGNEWTTWRTIMAATGEEGMILI
ncbi:fungal-specific transcription factor domain-containing protein [Mrakia frigida]|uniref:Zn(II)2Cys6 transcription factor n=1 Tax=Mrakia frigida TaxID=29902 RepID=UPI003FCC0F60